MKKVSIIVNVYARVGSALGALDLAGQTYDGKFKLRYPEDLLVRPFLWSAFWPPCLTMRIYRFASGKPIYTGFW